MAGSAEEAVARAYATAVLEKCGFAVSEEPFDFSRFPSRFASPLGALLISATVVGAARFGSSGSDPRLAAATLLAGLLLTVIFAGAMLGDAVLWLPFLRGTSRNLVATRGNGPPRVWLVAHTDTKSQPVPSATRVAGIVVLGLGLGVSFLSVMLTLGGVPARTMWVTATVITVAGALPLALSVPGNRSAGALDNASGVSAVLVAAELLSPKLAIGILLPSAEELGLAGVRAWMRGKAPSIALNCDGVDDDGSIVIMYSRRLPQDIARAVSSATSREVRVRRMPPGLLTDSTALVQAGWQAVTVSHGSVSSLRRVHLRADSLDAMRGTRIDEVGAILAHAAEALAP